MKTRNMVLGAMMTALTVILAQIQFPIGPVPISLATLGVFLSGALLGAKWGLFSQLAYVLLGAVGAPVFAGFSGGLAKLVGPTGGYLIGYVVAAWLIGLLTRGEETSIPRLILKICAGNAILLIIGTVFFMCLTGNTLGAALSLCVVPFLPGDALKIVAAAFGARMINARK